MNEPSQLPVSFADIEAAARRIHGHALHTPVLRAPKLDERLGAEIFLKCENFQHGGAFKFRGAYNAVVQLPEAQRRRGIVSYSSGNHAQGLALAARMLNVPVTIVMPRDAPRVKLEGTRALGAQVVLYERLEQRREEIARRMAAEKGLAVIPPFDHPSIIAGQGTAGLELLREVPDLDLLVAPIGGGGLISGCAIAAKALRPDIRIIGVEPAVANDTFLSLEAGRRIATEQARSIADGLLPTEPGELTFPIMARHLERVALVSEPELARATLALLLEAKILAEPSGAAPLAALQEDQVPDTAGKRVGLIISGGNVDPAWLGELLRQ